MSRKFMSKPPDRERLRSGFIIPTYEEDMLPLKPPRKKKLRQSFITDFVIEEGTGAIKAVQLAEILPYQYQPVTSRESHPDPPQKGTKRARKHMTDRDIEKRLSNDMLLSASNLAECESARKRGDKVFTQTCGEKCHVVEVFFEVDLDSMPSKQKPKFHTDHYPTIEIPAGAVYTALDCNLRRIFVYFNKGIETVYGAQISQRVLDDTTWNIKEYTHINPPEFPKDPNPNIDWGAFILSDPWDCLSRGDISGVYHWGCWRESEEDFCLTTDSIMVPDCVKPVLDDFTKTLGNMTRAHRILLGAVDKDYRDKGERMITGMRMGLKFPWVTDDNDCFSLRTCMVNAQVDQYYGDAFSNDEDAWLVMTPLGEFKGGELCVKELGRKFPHSHGTVGFIRAAKLEFFTARWTGERYSLECLQSMQIPEWAKIRIRRPNRRVTLVGEENYDVYDIDEDGEEFVWMDDSLVV
ncbi:hypothetical protein P167DRAFT_545208 [Morchella conica CCBAS932]|uniref:Uncharacterized protein n=1 Tax=Morchella conica CCBAS932 TaxID=1392247 RepID=A0A3N4KQL9_9PEZI|nr:hypothetical protein P167DRAFT_545208 [Morchella conica CCBAS932]